MPDGDEHSTHAQQRGLARHLLKLMVEADSSRFALSRIKAALVLIALLAAFAGLGYVVPALLVGYF